MNRSGPGRRDRRRSALRRLADLATSLALLAAVAVAAAYFLKLGEETVAGGMRVSDGDSLRLGERRIRLKGIDAPELAQTCTRNGGEETCGRASRDHLLALIGGREVTCLGAQEDRFGRLLAQCECAGIDLNAAMVRDGWAFAYGDYEREEAQARQARRGLWAYDIDNPRDWRREHPREEPFAAVGASEDQASVVRRTLTNLLDWLTSLFQ